MTTKQTRISQALADAGQPDPQPPPTETKKRSPVPSPEFVQARLRRDIRLLDERLASLTATFNEKQEKLTSERRRLVDGLKRVDEELAKANGASGG